MLTSASNLEQLKASQAFKGSKIKAAIRANDTTDIWRHRGATYHNKPARPYRTASLPRVKKLTDLGLYSMTFTGELDADLDQMYAFADFRDVNGRRFGTSATFLHGRHPAENEN